MPCPDSSTWRLEPGTSPPHLGRPIADGSRVGITFDLAVSIVLAKDDFNKRCMWSSHDGPSPRVDTSVLIEQGSPISVRNGGQLDCGSRICAWRAALADSSDSNNGSVGDEVSNPADHTSTSRCCRRRLEPYDPPGHGGRKAGALSERLQGRLLTLDANLRAIAKVRGLSTADLEQASSALGRWGRI